MDKRFLTETAQQTLGEAKKFRKIYLHPVSPTNLYLLKYILAGVRVMQAIY
jgi:hypothetical protein